MNFTLVADRQPGTRNSPVPSPSSSSLSNWKFTLAPEGLGGKSFHRGSALRGQGIQRGSLEKGS